MPVGAVRCGPENSRSGGLQADVVIGTILASGYRTFPVLAMIPFAAKGCENIHIQHVREIRYI